MKNRILSFVLAVVMVFAMIPAVAIGVSAADGMGITITCANYTVAPGGTAYVDLYASVDNLAGNDGLCNFQVYFDLPEGVTIAENGYTIYCEGVKTPQSTVNVKDGMIAATADAGEYLVMLDQLTAKGGALLATVAFNVTGDEGTVYDIIATKVTDFAMRSEAGDTKPSAADLGAAEFVGGKITVGTPATGETVETNGVVYFPASISAFAAADAAKYNGNSYVVKNTAPSDVSMFLIKQYTTPGFTVYCHKRTNRADTAATQIAAIGATVKNIMSAGAVVDGSTVTFYGNIVVEDVKYQDVFVEAVFTVDGEDRIFTTEKDPETNRYVYTTLTSGETVLVTTDEAVAEAGGTYVDGAYLFGGVINNVPAEVLSTLRVTAYGRTWDANGNLIYVCSDVWTPAA